VTSVASYTRRDDRLRLDVAGGLPVLKDDLASPSYLGPPVAEVALALYFAPPLDLRTVDMGAIWDRWRSRYPQSQDQPALPPVIPEAFDTPSMGLAIQLLPLHPPGRVWYLTESGNELVQVQHGRIVHNWRRQVEEAYPRYDTLRPAFFADVEDLVAFVADGGRGTPTVVQAELTYVNPIPMAQLGESRDMAELLAPWSGTYSDAFLPIPEDLRINARYRMTDPASAAPVGRLYVEGAPVLHQTTPRAEPEETYLLQLYARGRPLGEGVAGAFAFLDLGHDWIVRGFTSMTTTTMHDAWGRRD